MYQTARQSAVFMSARAVRVVSCRYRQMKKIPCPYCEQDADMEIGPDESMEELTDTAELQEIVEGENVEKMDRLLSLAITGGDYEWL